VLAAATALNGNFSNKVTTTVTAPKKEQPRRAFSDRDRNILMDTKNTIQISQHFEIYVTI